METISPAFSFIMDFPSGEDEFGDDYNRRFLASHHCSGFLSWVTELFVGMVALAKINEKAAKIAVKGSAKILRIVRSRVYPQAVDAFASRIKICEYRKPICEKQTALRTVQPC